MDGEPLKNEKFVFEIHTKETEFIFGETDDEGWIKKKKDGEFIPIKIPVNIHEATLSFGIAEEDDNDKKKKKKEKESQQVDFIYKYELLLNHINPLY